MSTPVMERRYVMLTPVHGSYAGHARLECQHGRCAVSIHASGLPEGPVRALLISGGENTGAVLDLGLMHRLSSRRVVLGRNDLAWHDGWHTLAIVADWPEARVLLWGAVRGKGGCTLWQAQKIVSHYLSMPALDASPAPQRPTVLRLPRRLST